MEWVHELWPNVAVVPSYRFAWDSWGLSGHSAKAEMRVAVGSSLLLQASYHYYHQGAASFWRGKYNLSEMSYEYYGVDKELGEIRGHDAGVGVSMELPGTALKVSSISACTRYTIPILASPYSTIALG